MPVNKHEEKKEEQRLDEYDKIGKIHEMLGRIDQRTLNLETRLDNIEKRLDQYVTRPEMVSLKVVTYGVTAIFSLSILGLLLASMAAS